MEEVKSLLEFGTVDVNHTDYDKRTALHLAAGEGHVEMVKLLCQRGANVNAQDRWGNRPLDDAAAAAASSSSQSGQQAHAIMAILRKYGATQGRKRGYDLGDSSTRRREKANLETPWARN